MHPTPEELKAEQHATARTAADLIVETAVVAVDAPLREAIAARGGDAFYPACGGRRRGPATPIRACNVQWLEVVRW